MEKKKRLNKTKLNLFLDVLLAAIFVVEMEEHFTGLALHEILGLLLAVAFIIHLILHWDWIVQVTLRFFKHLFHESRLNYVLNFALLADMVLLTVSGILISRTLGLQLNVGHIWEQIHRITADLSLLLVAFHVALHWKWIAQNTRKYLFGWVPGFRNAQTLARQER